MSDGKIDEAITTTTNENGDKEDETLNNSVSDGEIFDDEPEEEKIPIIDLPRKNLKNFRARHDNSDSEGGGSDGGTDKTKGITDGELRKLKNRMNGVQMLDKNVLENYRDKIINELGRKNERPQEFRRNFNPNSRFNAFNNGFRGNRDQNRRIDRSNGNRMSFSERNRNNWQRENGMDRPANADELRVVGIKRTLYFPLSSIKYTKLKPSLSFAERPPNVNKIRERSGSKASLERKQDESKKVKTEKKSPRKSESRDKEKISPKKSAESSKSSQISPRKTPTTVQEVKVERKDSDKKPKEIEKEKTPDDQTEAKTPEVVPEASENAKSPVKPPEKIKVELKLEKKKSPRRIEKPKVNIFLEDSDEVDEFESAIVEVRSKWSSPVRTVEEKKPPKMVSPPPVLPKFSTIPLVMESPEKSPLSIIPLTDNLFDIPKSVPIEKSPTPSPPPKPTKVRNVCSFLSDIASGNMFAGLGLGSGLYDDASSIDGLNLSDYKDADTSKLDVKSKIEVEAMEPDTTVIKSNFVGSITPSDGDSDSSDESESESSSSDSDDTTSESDESSDDSSDDDIPTFSGFGRFDASSMPMVTQIKPAATPTEAAAPSRFQPHQSVIKPPQLVTNVTKPAFYTPQSASATPTPFTVGLGTMSFPIPFKIYSLRDATNCEIMFPSPAVPAVQTLATPTTEKKDQDKEKKESERDRERDKKDSEKDKRESERRDRDRKRSRSRSRSHDRDRKRPKDDRRKTPPRSRVRAVEERKDSRRKEPSPRHNSHSSRSSHSSRQSPTRRQKRSRSRTPPPRHRSSPRPRTPPRQKSPPIKTRRSSPLRRSLSRSPKHRRSLSPVGRRLRSQSPVSRRSPRRRQSRSPRNRRGSSPDYRYERRSISPTFNKTDSPHGYRMDQIRPDSTISDTELERQQFMQEEFYLSQWNNSQSSSSPKRPNLDDRIHRMLSDSPTRNASHDYPPDAYQPYPYHDNRNGMFYQDMYPPGHHQMLPPHHDGYDYHGEFSSPRNFVNNSNLVDITQQNRDRQRAGNSQAVQVGNVLEIVPSNKVVNLPESSREAPIKSKTLSPTELKQQAEKQAQTKLKRKIVRERKRAEKQTRKEKLRQEIQRYFDAGVTVDVSDDESLIPLRSVNIMATVEKSILRKTKGSVGKEKKVLFSDGILPGETTSDDDGNDGIVESLKMKRRRKKYRKSRLVKAPKKLHVREVKESEPATIDMEVDSSPPPLPPADRPPANLKQPQLKKITVEMFAAFPVNPDPLYYYIHKVQQAKSMYQAQQQQQPPRPNDRFHYYKSQQPPVVNQSPSYPQPPRSLNNSVSALDPRIRSAEKSFT